MRFQIKETKHIVDLLFPIALFFVLTASCILLVLLSSNVYTNTVLSSETSYESRTVLSYLTKKIHQNDQNGAVHIIKFNDIDSLAIENQYGDQTYVTYVYVYDGYLRELFTQKGLEFSADTGKKILPIHNLKMLEPADHVFQFSYVNDTGKEVSTTVTLKSQS